MINIPTTAVIYASLAHRCSITARSEIRLGCIFWRLGLQFFFGGKVVGCAPPRMERMTNRLARATHCCRDVPQPEDYSFILNFDREAQTTDIAHKQWCPYSPQMIGIASNIENWGIFKRYLYKYLYKEQTGGYLGGY